MAELKRYFTAPTINPENYRSEILQYYGGSVSDFLSDMSDVALAPYEMLQAIPRGGAQRGDTSKLNEALDRKVRAKIRQRALSMELAEQGAAQARARQAQAEAQEFQEPPSRPQRPPSGGGVSRRVDRREVAAEFVSNIRMYPEYRMAGRLGFGEELKRAVEGAIMGGANPGSAWDLYFKIGMGRGFSREQLQEEAKRERSNVERLAKQRLAKQMGTGSSGIGQQPRMPPAWS